ncbi:putative 20S rRNA accumulation protein 4 [Mycena sanguinolenta]|uniref:Putative 20S rRNA accumulation protein 4 n=1 Tax=Mycena sanguinolenta TaxID=230812 RepID=A0A8H6Z4Z4_9AGAR|nr:putative 20S rRNA accumulation protein 4 [Mycena sanguinolenta]
MPPIDEDDWSDSDEEVVSEVETSVLLGTPDGAITVAADLADAAVSRIGGHPFSSSQCKTCSRPMELLVQMWCPFENSPMDRALYVWGCAVPECQSKEGCIRVWRGLRYNDEYAAKLAKKSAKQKAKPIKTTEKPKINPFSLGGVPNSTPFGLGAQIFGDSPSAASSPPGPPIEEPEDDHDTSDAGSDASSEELLTALAATTLEESPWRAAPSYPPLYLSTCSEYLPAQPKPKLPPGVEVVESLDDPGKGGKDVSWIAEAYENSLDVDQVFERFTKRVGFEGDQCKALRCRMPQNSVFQSLFPLPPAPPLPVTKAAFTVVPPARRTYDPSTTIPPCPVCKSNRVFECQLMPNLINVLRASGSAEESRKLTDEERRKLVEQELKGGSSGEGRGMEWGTCLIFSCSKDCSLADDGKDARESWREETVLIQWGFKIGW